MSETMQQKVAKAMEVRRMELIDRPLSRCYGELARAAIEAMAEEDAAKTFWQDWAAKRLEISRSQWLRAAKAALDRGDMRDLRLRVDLAEASPMPVVASEAALSEDANEKGAG